MIEILSNEVVNKIAAGEVVERPASVVKELIENSIDAGADDIKVYIEDFGTGLIRIKDNGAGIAQSDLDKVFLKHATSKLKKIEDLDEIASFGFRGEALASIASVSEILLASKNSADEMGFEVRVNNGKPEEIRPSGIPQGTDIQVMNLFGNIPARKKFLKSASTENKLILETIHAFVLANPAIAFYINIDGNERTYPASDSHDRVSKVFKLNRELLVPIFYDGKISISGFVVHPRHFLKSKQYQQTFVNGRYINDKTIYKAVLDGYDTFLMKNQFPGYVVFLSMPGNEVDINVHPRKTEVRFSNPSEIYKSVRLAVNVNLTKFLKQETLKKVGVKPTETSFITPASLPSFTQETVSEHSKIYGSGSEQQETKQESTTVNSDAADFARFLSQSEKGEATNHFIQNKAKTEDALLFNNELIKEEESSGNDLGIDIENATQLLNSYILTSNKESILIIDQHAASERFFYEKYLKDIKSGKVVSKQLLFPVIITLEDFSTGIVEQHKELFEKFGFKIEVFGSNEIKIAEVPEFVKTEQFEKVFNRILNDIVEHDEASNIDDTIYHETAAILACHTAVRFGDKLTKPEIIKLLKNLTICEDPYNCPHGRPVIQEWTKYDIEKKFKRCGL